MDIVSIILSVFSGFMLFIMLLSLDDILSGTKKDKYEMFGIFLFLIFLVSSPFLIDEIDHDITYTTTTGKKLVRLVDGVETYREKCDVKLKAHIPFTAGMYDEYYDTKPFDSNCIDLTDEDYTEIEKHISYFRVKVNQKD